MSKTGWLACIGAASWLWSRRLRLRAVRPGQVVIVTGGSRGLGLLLARRFARRGASVVIVARDEDELRVAKERIKNETGARVLALSDDLRDPKAGRRLVDAVVERFGRIDVLVNDAGVIQVGPHQTMSDEEYRHAMQTNFLAALRLTRAALPHLAAAAGSIVNISSIGGAVPVPHLLPYTASKFAMTGWSTGLATEVADDGVRVTTVLPWLMRTGSFLHAQVKGRREKEARNFALSSSLPFLTLSAERVADRILLAVDRGERFVTVGTPAKALRLGFALFPSTAIAVLSLVNRFLPRMKGDAVAGPGDPAEPLWKHRKGAAKSFLTRLGDVAARENNEMLHVT